MTANIIAIALSTVAIGISIWSGLFNKRSTVAAEDSAVSSRTSSDASKVSAAAALASADAAEKVARAEVLRDHEMYRPDDPDAQFERTHGTRTDIVWFVFTAPRGYRIKAHGIHDSGGKIPLSVDPGLVVHAGRQVRVHVGEVKGIPLPDRVSLEFWPPVEMDGGELWTCECGRPADPEGPAHWVWNREVTVPPDRRAKVYSA